MQRLEGTEDTAKISTRSLAHTLTSLRQWTKFMIGDGILQIDPCEHIDLPQFAQTAGSVQVAGVPTTCGSFSV